MSVGEIMVTRWLVCTPGERCGDFPVPISVTDFDFSSLNVGAIQDKTWRLHASFIISTAPSKGMAPNLYLLPEHSDLKSQDMQYFLHSPHILTFHDSWIAFTESCTSISFLVSTPTPELKADRIGPKWTTQNCLWFCLELPLENYWKPQ